MNAWQIELLVRFARYILTGTGYSVAAPAVRISLGFPTITTKEGKIMANYPLKNDQIVTIPILTDDAAGDPVAPPSGDAFAVVSSIPASLNAEVSGNNVVLNALVAAHMNPAGAAPDLFFTVSDSKGLTTFVQVVDIVADTAPSAITLDFANATTASQPVPTAPGP